MDQFADFSAVPAVEALPSHDAVINQMVHFIDCWRTNTEPSSSVHDNLETMAVLDAIVTSHQNGGSWVDICHA